MAQSAYPLYTPVGFYQVTVTSTARALEFLIDAASTGAVVPTQSRRVLIQAQASIRYRDDGTHPTASVGHWIYSDGTVPTSLLYEGDLDTIELIRVGSSNVTVNLTFYA